jgi:cell pole-organizing protein PopZ
MDGDEQMGLNPFEESQAEEEELLMSCWRIETKVCGPDCVAYDERSAQNPVFSPCILLNLQRAQAKSLANIAEELKRYNDSSEAAIQQAVESNEVALEQAEKRAEAKAYGEKVKEMDKPPPEIK